MRCIDTPYALTTVPEYLTSLDIRTTHVLETRKSERGVLLSSNFVSLVERSTYLTPFPYSEYVMYVNESSLYANFSVESISVSSNCSNR